MPVVAMMNWCHICLHCSLVMLSGVAHLVAVLISLALEISGVVLLKYTWLLREHPRLYTWQCWGAQTAEPRELCLELWGSASFEAGAHACMAASVYAAEVPLGPVIIVLSNCFWMSLCWIHYEACIDVEKVHLCVTYYVWKLKTSVTQPW